MSKLVLQINSIDVVNRLIGGDNEIEVELRNSVVQNLCSKQLRLLSETRLAEVQGVLERLFKQEFKDLMDWGPRPQNAHFYYGIVLTKEFKKELREGIDAFVKEEIENATSAVIASQRAFIVQKVKDWEECAQRRIDHQMETCLKNTEAAIEKRFNECVEKEVECRFQARWRKLKEAV